MTDLALVIKKNTLILKGHIHFKNVQAILEKSLQSIQTMSDISVDLHQVHNSDSSGLALLIEYARVANQHKKNIQFLGVPNFIKEIARVYGLTEVLNLSWEN